MTRPCGCGGNALTTCNCVVQGEGVTGAGNPDNPYVVNPLRTTLAVVDSPTIDHTLTGSPAAGYSLTSGAKISGQAQNALVAGSDGGLYVPQGAQGALVTGCGLVGTGAAATPLRLASPQTVSGYAAGGATVTYTAAQFNAGQSVTTANMVTITNPSTCQSMICEIQGGGRIRFSNLDTYVSAWAGTITFTLLRGGTDVGILQSLQAGRRTNNSEYYWVENYPPAPVTLAPGASATWGLRMDTNLQGPSQVDTVFWNMPALSVIGHLV